tara:strand:+ start:906 stop:1199 length:294 start_codon:yes stop_codon:yes gene_type:complete
MMARFKTVATPSGQSQVEITGDELAALEAGEQAYADGATARAWAALRGRRDELLAETDWWGLSDLTMSDGQKAYRRALRDLPANTSDPSNASWPNKP